MPANRGAKGPAGVGRPPTLSVVVVTYNSRADIAACLAALAKQRGVSFETVVVDNGSRDGTAAFVRDRFPSVQVVEQGNVGFGGGNNKGVSVSRGEIVLFLNPDTVPEPGFLAAMAEAVAEGRIATAQLVLRSNPRLLNTCGNALHFTGFSFVAGYLQPRIPAGPPRPVPGISGAAFALRRDEFLSLGGFDEDFFLYLEDTEFSWRARRAGFDLVFAPAAVATHDYAFEVNAWKLEHLETGRLLVLRKHLPRRLWLAYLPSLLAAELLAWAWAARLGWPGLRSKARALRRGWRPGIGRPGLPRARPHRFASRRFPFAALGVGRAIRSLGMLFNGVFLANTLVWPLRRRSPRGASPPTKPSASELQRNRH